LTNLFPQISQIKKDLSNVKKKIINPGFLCTWKRENISSGWRHNVPWIMDGWKRFVKSQKKKMKFVERKFFERENKSLLPRQHKTPHKEKGERVEKICQKSENKKKIMYVVVG
jgi:hypothetical protein